MAPIKLYLDEHIDIRLAEALRRLNFDAVTTQEANLLSVSDEKQIEFAISQNRAIITNNFNHYTALHEQYIAEGKEHWGIILTTQTRVYPIFHWCLNMLNSVTAEEMKNQLRWLNDFRT